MASPIAPPKLVITGIGGGGLVQLFGKGSTCAGPHDNNDQRGEEEDLLSAEGFDDPAEQPAAEGGLAQDVEGDLVVSPARRRRRPGGRGGAENCLLRLRHSQHYVCCHRDSSSS